MGKKREKKHPAHQIARKKVRDDLKSPTAPPPPPQELNCQPLRTSELFLCFVLFVFLGFIVLISLFSLFYVTGGFLHRG